jgi:hypothetical protein
MTLCPEKSNRSSSGVTHAENFSLDQSTASAVYSLLDAVDSESIADEFDIGKHSKKHDFDNHLKVAVREGIDPSDSLAELEETTETDAEMEKMAAPTFSRYTNDRDYRAVVRTMFELLHTPQLTHQRAVERKRLQRLTRGVVATDATNLELTRSVVVSDEFVGDDEQSYEINTDDGGIKLHLAARVDGEHRHPLGATVTEGETHESLQFEHLYGDVKVFPDLDSPIWVFDRGYTRYERFCGFTDVDDDFITLLESDARYEVTEQIQTVEVTEGDETRQVRDDRIELAGTGEQFRRVMIETPDGEQLEYLTTLASSEYDPVDVISIYTLRTVIEIIFRELKQYLNVENFHSQSLNGVLFELFCALIGLLLIQWLRQRHPMRGGVPNAIREVRKHWNGTLRSVG